MILYFLSLYFFYLIILDLKKIDMHLVSEIKLKEQKKKE